MEEQQSEKRSDPAGVWMGIVGLLAVVAAWAALELWGVGGAPFHTRGEPREALVVQEMVRSGDWILPRRNGVELPSKPPFFHWFGAAVSLAHGAVDEWSVRLPSVLASGACLLCVYFAALRLWGWRAALVSGLVLLTSFEWQRAATAARVDMVLTWGTTASFVALLLFRRSGSRLWLPVFYLGLAWAFLSKGPLVAALPLLMLPLLCVLDFSLAPVRDMHPVRGLLCTAVLSSPWYVLAAQRGGREFLERHLLFENLTRITGGADYTGGHQHSAAYLAGGLLLGFLPWTLFAPAVVSALRASRAELTRRHPVWFLFLWIACVFLPYSLASSKRSVYLLALYPALALLLGWSWERGERNLRRLGLPAGVLAALLAVLCVLVAAQMAGLPAFALLAGLLRGEDARTVLAVGREAGPPLFSLLAGAALATGLLAVSAWHGHRAGTLTGTVLAAGLIMVAVQQVVLPAVAREKTRRDFVVRLHRLTGGDLFSYREFDYGVAFYRAKFWGMHMPIYSGDVASSSAPRFLLVSDKTWRRLGFAQRGDYGVVPGLESDGEGNMGRILLVARGGAGTLPASEARR